MKIALAHDVLAARAGGERVLCALADLWPDAEIHTLLHEPAATFDQLADRPIVTSWLNRFPLARRRYRMTVPVAALTWSRSMIDADVTICSSSGLSHHVRTTGARIVYCHTPSRWIHHPDTYLDGYGRLVRMAAGTIRRPLERLDRSAMQSADLIVANSHQIASEIATLYGRDADVVPPCSTLELDGPIRAIDGVDPGFVLAPMRPLGYKRFDVLLAAARRRPDLRFLHVGEGPHRQALLDEAPSNLTSVGAVTDAELRWAYRHACRVVVTAAEDFGLVPLEAAAHGHVTLAPDARGLRDHDAAIIHPYPFGSVDGLLQAIDRAPGPTGVVDPSRLGREQFAASMTAAVASVAP